MLSQLSTTQSSILLSTFLPVTIHMVMHQFNSPSCTITATVLSNLICNWLPATHPLNTHSMMHNLLSPPFLVCLLISVTYCVNLVTSVSYILDIYSTQNFSLLTPYLSQFVWQHCLQCTSIKFAYCLHTSEDRVDKMQWGYILACRWGGDFWNDFNEGNMFWPHSIPDMSCAHYTPPFKILGVVGHCFA